jgi:hypothetical protein
VSLDRAGALAQLDVLFAQRTTAELDVVVDRRFADADRSGKRTGSRESICRIDGRPLALAEPIRHALRRNGSRPHGRPP